MNIFWSKVKKIEFSNITKKTKKKFKILIPAFVDEDMLFEYWKSEIFNLKTLGDRLRDFLTIFENFKHFFKVKIRKIYKKHEQLYFIIPYAFYISIPIHFMYLHTILY